MSYIYKHILPLMRIGSGLPTHPIVPSNKQSSICLLVYPNQSDGWPSFSCFPFSYLMILDFNKEDLCGFIFINKMSLD
jgi:hypothetical protein